MLVVSNVSMQFGGRVLYKDVNLSFTQGNCYGVIGANGAGKSTFLKIISNELEPTSGSVTLTENERMSILKQNQNEYDDFTLVDTVIQGHSRLVEIMKEKDELYAKTDFSEEDGIKAAELESEFATLEGWEADSNARSLLSNLGINEDKHDLLMKEIDSKEKVKVLLAQALFGNPDILLLDEPTNNLDALATKWLENFLFNFKNIVIIVSHDRYFLNKVCTRICDVDYGKINLFVGNYDFWYQSSQLIARQMKDSNAKKEQKMKELQDFIARFSANASKSKQATSRKKELEKIKLEDIVPSSRVYPYIDFKFEREIGKDVLEVNEISKEGLLNKLSFVLRKGDKVAFISKNTLKITSLFNIISGVDKEYEGSYKYGITITPSYIPNDNSSYFEEKDLTLVDWLRPYSKDQTETYVRSWLGRMLFSNEEALKKVDVLSGGEKVRCMMAKTMLTSGNLLILDDPTNHLDLESITALNNGLINYKGVLLFSSHDHELINTVANRIIYLGEDKVIDKYCTYDEFLELYENEI